MWMTSCASHIFLSGSSPSSGHSCLLGKGTKARKTVNYFSSQKLKWNPGIKRLLQEIESEGALTNNKVGTAAILVMMK